MRKKLIMAIFAISTCYYSQAQSGFKYKRITVFKDGTSFIEKTITVPTSNKIIHFKNLPISLNENTGNKNISYSSEDDRISLGSLRFSAENNVVLGSIVKRSMTDSTIKQKEYESITELLELNTGKKVKITQENVTKPTIAKINKVTNNVVVVQSDNNFSIISIEKIVNIEFIDKPVTKKEVTHFSGKASASMELKLLKDSKNQQINLSYLRKGMTWLPTYFIDLYEQKKGKLSLEANLLNDIEDVRNTEINFAVGVPSFAFKTVNEPLISNNSVWEILRQLNQQQLREFSQGIEMNIMSQGNMYNAREASAEYTPQMEGVGGEDLYFYKKQNISLSKYGRMKVQLLSMDFDYEDVYSCELDKNNARREYNSESKINIVWHSIRFKNMSKHPLTTGTVFFKKEDKGQIALVSQNQLDYTPEDEFVTAKMTVAPDIVISGKDIETDRKAVNNDYLLSIDGEVNIVNYKSFPVDIIIERKIIGTLLDSDKAWKVTSNLETYNARNTSNQVSWKLKIGAGKTLKIKYKYKILVD